LGTTYDTGGKNPCSAPEVSGETTRGQLSDAAANGMDSNNGTIICHGERRESSGASEIPDYCFAITW